MLRSQPQEHTREHQPEVNSPQYVLSMIDRHLRTSWSQMDGVSRIAGCCVRAPRHESLCSTWCVVSVVVCLLLVAPMAVQAARRTNFVIIMVDDMGYGDAGCYGGTAFPTPNLDRLATEGMMFTDFHSSGCVCSPTRAGLLTGRYQQRAGIPGVVYAALNRNRHHGLQLQETTFAEVLNAAGYATAAFGKWHVGYEEQYNPVYQGFDRYVGYVSGNVDFHTHIDGAGVFD